MSIKKIILLTGSCFFVAYLQAQSIQHVPDTLAKYKNLTLVYDIKTKSTRENSGIEETYNGGVKTVMIQNEKTRIRLVTLMRIQSIYFFKKDSILKKILITKESGKKRYKYQLTPLDWKKYNTKYDSISYTLLDDSVSVAGYMCKKAIITVPTQNKEITVYYSNALKPLDKKIEPLFAGLPGIVLKYEHAEEGGTICFTANKVSFELFDEKLLQEPDKGFLKKVYTPAVQ